MAADQIIEIGAGGEVKIIYDDLGPSSEGAGSEPHDFLLVFKDEFERELMDLDPRVAAERKVAVKTSIELGQKLSRLVNTIDGRKEVQNVQTILERVIQLADSKDPAQRLIALMRGEMLSGKEQVIYFEHRPEKDTVSDDFDIASCVARLHGETKWIAESRKYSEALGLNENMDDLPPRPFLPPPGQKGLNGNVPVRTLNRAFYAGWQQMKVEGMNEIKTVG